MRNALRQQLYDFLEGCQPPGGLLGGDSSTTAHASAGVVIIDEIEKMASGSLDVSSVVSCCAWLYFILFCFVLHIS